MAGIAVYKAKPERIAVVASGAEQAVVTMGKANDELLERVAQERQWRQDAEARLERKERELHQAKGENEALRTELQAMQEHARQMQGRLEDLIERMRVADDTELNLD